MNDSDFLELGGTLLSVDALRKDVGRFVEKFRMHDNWEFKSFAQLWKQEKMSMLQFACVEDLRREVYMDTLFATCVDAIVYGADSASQAGAVYVLYVLYQTQPARLPIFRIKVTSPTWEKLHSIYLRLASEGWAEAAVVFKRLAESGALVLSFYAKDQASSVPMTDNDLRNFAQYQHLLGQVDRTEEEMRLAIDESHKGMEEAELEEYEKRVNRAVAESGERLDNRDPLAFLDSVKRDTANPL